MPAQVTSFSMEVKNTQMTQKTISRTDLCPLCSMCVCECQHALDQIHASKPLTDIHDSLCLLFSCTKRKEQDQRKRQQGRERDYTDKTITSAESVLKLK